LKAGNDGAKKERSDETVTLKLKNSNDFDKAVNK